MNNAQENPNKSMLQHLEVDNESSSSSSEEFYDDDMDERPNIIDKIKPLYSLPLFKGLNHLNRMQNTYSQKMKANLQKLQKLSMRH